MKKMIILMTLAILAVSCNYAVDQVQDDNISGKISKGLREITIDMSSDQYSFTVYKGDYVKFILLNVNNAKILIPDLEIDQLLPPSTNDKPYIKFPKAGSFPININEKRGNITVIAYTGSHYYELRAKDVPQTIKNISPMILDVRTPSEYKSGHIANATLIPVQEIQQRINELNEYKEQPIIVYCRSGNRSTVASKILIDAGYKQIYNMVDGFSSWAGNNLPIEK